MNGHIIIMPMSLVNILLFIVTLFAIITQNIGLNKKNIGTLTIRKYRKLLYLKKLILKIVSVVFKLKILILVICWMKNHIKYFNL